MRGGYFLLFFSISALLCEVKAQTDYISISGYVLDQSSKEALPIATIVLSSQDKKTGVIANAYGFYTVKLDISVMLTPNTAMLTPPNKLYILKNVIG